MKLNRKVIPLWCALIVSLHPALAADSTWSQSQTTLSIKEYFDLFFATRFRDSNATEPVEATFVANGSKEEALLFLLRPVVLPDVDLTDDSDEKDKIIKDFQNNVSKQADAYLTLGRTVFQDNAITKRWPGATVERNLAIRFVRSDNVKQTVALTVNGSTTFSPDQIGSQSKSIRVRAGELWLE